MYKHPAVWLLLLTPVMAASDVPPIRFPEPAVVPAPNPAAIPVLGPDQLYVIDSDVELMVGTFPGDLLSVSKETGPLKIRGRFVDGNGKVQTRTYKGKFIVVIEAAGTGRATLVVVPVGAKTETDWIIKPVDAAATPAPPVPDPTPGPGPSPKVDKVWVITVDETGERTPETGKVLNDLAFWKGLQAAGHKYRQLDKDSAEAANKNYLKALQKQNVTLPGVLILDSKGQVLRAAKLPPSTAGIKAMIDEVTK